MMQVHANFGCTALYLVVSIQGYSAQVQRFQQAQAATAASAQGVKSAPESDTCPLTVTIDARGYLYDSRFHGKYRVSERTLASDIGGGCKQAGPTSSVRVEAARQVLYGRLKQVMDLIHKSGPPGLPVKIIAPPASHRFVGLR